MRQLGETEKRLLIDGTSDLDVDCGPLEDHEREPLLYLASHELVKIIPQPERDGILIDTTEYGKLALRVNQAFLSSL